MSTVPLSMLRALRDERGLRQIDVAAKARVDPSVVKRIDRGQIMGMKMRSLIRVAAALRVSPVDVIPALAVVPKLEKRRPVGQA